MGAGLKRLGSMLGGGIAEQFAPSIIQGVLVSVFKSWNPDVRGATRWVQQDVVLWNKLSLRQQEQVIRGLSKVRDLKWLNADWVIQAIKQDFPGLASLYLGWDEAHEWLERQVTDILGHISR